MLINQWWNVWQKLEFIPIRVPTFPANYYQSFAKGAVFSWFMHLSISVWSKSEDLMSTNQQQVESKSKMSYILSFQ